MKPNQWTTSALRIAWVCRCKPCPPTYRQKQGKIKPCFQNILQSYPHQNEKNGLKTRPQMSIILNSYAGTCSKSHVGTQTPWLLSMLKPRIFPLPAPKRKDNLEKGVIKIAFLSPWWDKIQGRQMFYLPSTDFRPNCWALRDRHHLLGLKVTALGKPQVKTDPRSTSFKTWYHLFIFPAFEKVTFDM